MDSTSNSEYYRKLSQQIVQKDNLIRLLRMQLDKQKEGISDEDLSMQLIDLKEELNETIVRLEDYISENKSLKEEIENLKTLPTTNNTGDDRIETLEVECESLHDKIAHLEKENIRLSKEIDDKTGYIQILKGEIDELKIQNNLSEESREFSSYSEGSITDILKKVESKLNEYDISGKNIDDIRLLLKSVVGEENSGIESLLREKDEEINKLKLQLSENNPDIMEKKLLQEKIDALNEELRNLRKSSNNLSQESSLSLVYNLIQIIDEFKEIDNSKENGDVKEYIGRMNVIHNIVKKLSNELNIKPIPTIGEKFSPKFHEVSEYIRSKEHEEGTIVEEIKTGFLQNERVLRPALVKIVKNSQTCQNCGNVLRIGSLFCDSCGTKLEKLDVPFAEIKNTSEMYFNTGKIFFNKGMNDKAKEYIQQALSLEPENNQYLFYLGLIFENDGNYDDSLSCLKKIKDTDIRYEKSQEHIQNILIKRNIVESLKSLV